MNNDRTFAIAVIACSVIVVALAAWVIFSIQRNEEAASVGGPEQRAALIELIKEGMGIMDNQVS